MISHPVLDKEGKFRSDSLLANDTSKVERRDV
jgi:hypothetical protein